MNELAKWFPRAGDMTAATAIHWSKIDEQRQAFFGAVNVAFNALQSETGRKFNQTERTRLIHYWLDVDHLEDSLLDQPAAINVCRDQMAKGDFTIATTMHKTEPKPPPQAPARPPVNGTGQSGATTAGPLNEAQIRAKYTKRLQGGKEYLEVAGRMLLFRMAHPKGGIISEHISLDATGAVFRCSVVDGEGNTLGTGYGAAQSANSKNISGRFIEKAETAARGRALAAAGFGTDEADDDYLADTPVGK